MASDGASRLIASLVSRGSGLVVHSQVTSSHLTLQPCYLLSSTNTDTTTEQRSKSKTSVSRDTLLSLARGTDSQTDQTSPLLPKASFYQHYPLFSPSYRSHVGQEAGRAGSFTSPESRYSMITADGPVSQPVPLNRLKQIANDVRYVLPQPRLGRTLPPPLLRPPYTSTITSK